MVVTSVETGDARQSLASKFFCPNCSKTMEVKINKKSSTATTICPNCGLKYETSFKSELTEPVDIYSELMDKFYKKHRVRDSISIKINTDGTPIVYLNDSVDTLIKNIENEIKWIKSLSPEIKSKTSVQNGLSVFEDMLAILKREPSAIRHEGPHFQNVRESLRKSVEK
jgi:transcription elongation factor Elf1